MGAGDFLNIRLGNFCFIINIYLHVGLKYLKLKVNRMRKAAPVELPH